MSFFVEQSLFDDARATLHDLQDRFPGHPRLQAKLREVAAFEARQAAVDAAPGPGATPGNLSLDVTPSPRAFVEGGASVDASTHADLAIAYKEMGLFDAAIGELKLLADDDAREVFALTMMGECFEQKGSFTDAVIRYKQALNCPQINAEEMLLLYYLLGSAFERLGDGAEALYFYDKVVKREQGFRDVRARVAALRAPGAPGAPGQKRRP